MLSLMAVVFLSTLSISFIATPLVRNAANRYGLVDTPREKRQLHTTPIPRIGGIAIAIAFFIGLPVAYFESKSRTLPGNLDAFLAFMPPCLAMFLLGLTDDIFRLSAKTKSLIQVLIALWFYFSAAKITNLSVPFTQHTIELGWLAPVITVIWLVGITNAFNLIDGMDGLSAGSALFTALSVMYVSLVGGQTEIALLTCALAGSILGFLRYNFNPATVFMGDSGSLFIGFILAALAIRGAQKGTTMVAIAIPLVSFGLPVLETLFSMARRFLAGKPVFTADRKHIHHQLLAKGFSQRQVVIVLYGFSALFALFGVLMHNAPTRAIGFILLTLGVSVWLAVQHLGYHEFGEIGQVVQRSLRQRTIIANNIAIREVFNGLRYLRTYREVFEHLNHSFHSLDFKMIELHIPFTVIPQFTEEVIGCFSFEQCDEYWIARWTIDQETHPTGDLVCLRIPGVFGKQQGSITFYRLPRTGPWLFEMQLLANDLPLALFETFRRLKLQSELELPAITLNDPLPEVH